MQGSLNVPGYTLVRRLEDSGGQAMVHLGRSVAAPHHEAAIKIYHSTLRSSHDRQRFQREVEAMQRLAADPDIIDVYDFGVLDNGQAFLAMRLCPGGSLASLLAERGPLSAAAVISLGETLAEALGRAHRLGVSHRDVKPHNILLGDDGSPVLTDFGIVALKNQEPLGGWTASYAAPELFHDEPATVRTDIYGLAATLYTMLAGHPPHHDRQRNPSPSELLWRRNSKPARIDGVPTKLMDVLLQALSPAPEERFATAHAFAAALREAVPATAADPASNEAGPKFTVGGINPRRAVKLTPSVQPGLLLTALVGTGLVCLWSMTLVPAAWGLWWTGFTVLIGLLAGMGRFVLALVAFAASVALALAVAVKGYDASPPASIGWIIAAFGVGVLAILWGRGTSAVRLRWFALRHRVKRRRWWGQASVRAEFRELESLPGTRFLRLDEGTCHYAVTCGSAVALVRWAPWPDGDYVATDEAVRRNGKVWPQGVTELERARRGLTILDVAVSHRRGRPASVAAGSAQGHGVSDLLSRPPGGVKARVFLAVDTPGALRLRELRGELTVCHARELVEVLGRWLATEPYSVDLELLARLMPLAQKAS